MARSSSDLRAIGQFKNAIEILDTGEPRLREIIEGGLMDATGVHMTKANMVDQIVRAVLEQYAAERTQQIQLAFRYLRANLE